MLIADKKDKPKKEKKEKKKGGLFSFSFKKSKKREYFAPFIDNLRQHLKHKELLEGLSV